MNNPINKLNTKEDSAYLVDCIDLQLGAGREQQPQMP